MPIWNLHALEELILPWGKHAHWDPFDQLQVLFDQLIMMITTVMTMWFVVKATPLEKGSSPLFPEIIPTVLLQLLKHGAVVHFPPLSGWCSVSVVRIRAVLNALAFAGPTCICSSCVCYYHSRSGKQRGL